MRIPSHWSKATAEGKDTDGQTISFSCWRSSEQSAEDAHESALAAANRILRSFMQHRRLDRYAYGQASLREEVIQRFPDTEGGLFAAVTRNGYGSLVLNTASVCFIDLDFQPIPLGDQFKHFFRRLFGKSSQPPEMRQEAETVARLEQFIQDHPHWGLRVYRTFAGMRLLATHDLFDPLSGDVTEACEFLHADPLYMRLCRAQQCFRARLTPKPWRCGHYPNTIVWPRDGQKPEVLFQQWLSGYNTCQSKYATCRHVASLGNATIHPDVETIIEIHDKITRCPDSVALA